MCCSTLLSLLAQALKSGSGKKILEINQQQLPKGEEGISKLVNFTKHYHYILVAITNLLEAIALDILKEADRCYLITSTWERQIIKLTHLISQIKRKKPKDKSQKFHFFLKHIEKA